MEFAMRSRDKDNSSIVHAADYFTRGSRTRLRRLARDPTALSLVRAVAVERQVELESLLQTNRGNASIARSRQLAMYLVHVVLGRPQDVVGLLFGRDRTTVSHACHLMEDRRDDPSVESQIVTIERRFGSQLGSGFAEEFERVA
ncbi:MAG: helix-turn-helix domain-containing protein [Devosia sp.]